MSAQAFACTAGSFQPRIQQAIAASDIGMQGPPDMKEFAVHDTFQP